MYAIHLLQEGTQQGGIGGYVWVALVIFFLMVFLGWLVASKGWLKKDEEPAPAVHGHDEHEAGHHADAAPSQAVTAEAPASAKHIEAAVESAPASPAAADDLTTLEGIGPKVAKVLGGIGITTFEGLANAEYTKVKSALDGAGYKYMDPAGWMEQAALASKGDMDGLKKLQDALKGGRKAA
jgi:predicted flap endonuclease-1-like 5' DNA nuclease